MSDHNAKVPQISSSFNQEKVSGGGSRGQSIISSPVDPKVLLQGDRESIPGLDPGYTEQVLRILFIFR